MPIYTRDGQRLVTATQAAVLLGVTVGAVGAARSRGTFPEPTDWVDARTPVWVEADLALTDPIPAELRASDHWLPRSGRAASAADPLDYPTARAASRSVSFLLDGDGIVCAQVAHCLRADGQLRVAIDLLTWWADRTYIEISPSGDGLHLWGCGELLASRKKKHAGAQFEVHGTDRRIPVTGERFGGSPSWLADLTPLIDLL